VPDPAHHLSGETTLPAEGTYATEAGRQNSGGKS